MRFEFCAWLLLLIFCVGCTHPQHDTEVGELAKQANDLEAKVDHMTPMVQALVQEATTMRAIEAAPELAACRAADWPDTKECRDKALIVVRYVHHQAQKGGTK